MSLHLPAKFLDGFCGWGKKNPSSPQKLLHGSINNSARKTKIFPDINNSNLHKFINIYQRSSQHIESHPTLPQHRTISSSAVPRKTNARYKPHANS